MIYVNITSVRAVWKVRERTEAALHSIVFYNCAQSYAIFTSKPSTVRVFVQAFGTASLTWCDCRECHWLTRKMRLRNDQRCVEWDISPLAQSDNESRNDGVGGLILSYLRVRRNDVDETDDGQQNDTDEPENELFPERERLHEAHLLSVPDARQMLLAVRMSDELQQQQQQHISPQRRQ